MYHEDVISVLGTNRSQKEPCQENMGDEEWFHIHIQSQQSRQLVTCQQGCCPARAEHCDTVFFVSFMQFPGVATSIHLHNMHRLTCDLAQDNRLLTFFKMNIKISKILKDYHQTDWIRRFWFVLNCLTRLSVTTKVPAYTERVVTIP